MSEYEGYAEEANMTITELVDRTINERIDLYGYEVSMENIKKIVLEITDSEDFYQRLDAIIEDALHDTMDQLSIDQYPFTEEEEKKKADFFNKGQFLVAPEYMQYANDDPANLSYYLWENFKEATKFAEENDQDIRIYTLLEAEGRGYIVKGARWVNRFAYLLTVGDAGLDENDEVRFW